MHGYDVIDPTRVNPELGGEAALRALVAALRRGGLGLIVDIVPNHMAADTGQRWWVDVLRTAAPAATRATSTSTGTSRATRSCCRSSAGRCRGAGRGRARCRAATTLRYFASFAAAPRQRGSLADALARQHYRLAWWRTAGDRINWRRFFDINELVCLRMEDAGGLRGRACADRCGSMPRA